MDRFVGAEGDGHRGRDRRSVDSAGIGIDTARDVDGDDRRGDLVHDRGRCRSQRAASGEADDAVEHEVRVGDVLGSRRKDPSAGLPQCPQTRRVRPIGGEQQRGDGHATAAQEGSRPQRIAAVVAGPDEQTHPPTGDPTGAFAQFGSHDPRESVGRAPHERPLGERLQQRRLRRTDHVGRVKTAHRPSCTGGWAAIRR